MKKIAKAAAVLPSILVSYGLIFASDSSLKDLSQANETIKQLIEEQKDFQKPPQENDHNKPDHNNPVHPPKPDPKPDPKPQPPIPHPQPVPNPQPPQPQPVDTTQAYQAGLRDGSEKGMREGRRDGYSAGLDEGEREGRRAGYDQGNADGRRAGYRDGLSIDQSAAVEKGRYEGERAGTSNGISAGEKRCYDEGYTSGYNSAYAAAKILGLQDEASYNAGYAKGQSDASGIESEKGRRAGYQAGFAQRESELQASLETLKMPPLLSKSISYSGGSYIPVDMAKAGFNTPEERQAYERGFRDGYQRSYRRAYDDAKRDGYNQTYSSAYRRAYDSQYSISYRDGFSQGKDEGYQRAYNAAYNSAYNSYYEQYSSMDYPQKRDMGLAAGRTAGDKAGFADGCAQQNKKGYKEGYEKKAAEVYPQAFETGKQAGIASADKYYSENSVLKVFDVSLYDENGNGKFEAGENVFVKAEIKNFGFQKSEQLSLSVRSERGEIVLESQLTGEAVSARNKALLTLKAGKLYDVVSPDSDALIISFSEKGQDLGSFRLMYARTNTNKVGIVNEDDTSVTEKATWFFPGKITSLDKGAKVLIIGEKGNYFKVRKSEMIEGKWSEGYISKDKLTLQ